MAEITRRLERLILALELHQNRPKVLLASQTETHAMFNQEYGGPSSNANKREDHDRGRRARGGRFLLDATA